MEMYQQGDVLFKTAQNIPKDAKKLNHVTFAEGEVTGHYHRATDPSALNLFEYNSQMYAEVFKECVVQHQEHHQIILPPGTYQIDIVKEYDHFSEEARAVAD